MAKSSLQPGRRILNKKARLNFEILETFEAGIALKGPEVKSLRAGSASLDESYARIEDDGVVLVDFQIDHYAQATTIDLPPKRPRRLLLSRREIKKLSSKTAIRGQTLIPLAVYFNERGLAKVELALAKGKSRFDKREAVKAKDARQEIDRARRYRR
jgi:SsrA-binding protein